MEFKISCPNNTTYIIDDSINHISKTSKNGNQQLTYKDFTKMFLDFAKVKLDEKDVKAMKEYLLNHPFTTFLFCSFNKEKFQPSDTIETIVEKLEKKPAKLLSTFASSILFLQTQNIKYENLNQPNALPTLMTWRFNTFDAAYHKWNLKTYEDFPVVSYSQFLVENQALLRNSTSVEQTLKLINLDPNSFVYNQTKSKWDNYLLGKNSQLSFKQAFPILNLTCTYSLYKINFKDKDFEDNLKRHVQYVEEHKDSYDFRSLSSNAQVFSSTYGIYLFQKVLREKVTQNPAFKNSPIIDYLLEKFNYRNYIDNPSDEKEKMIQWLMKYEGSNNRDLFNVEVSEIIKHNVDHCFGKVQYLTSAYGKELGLKPAIPQELQKFCFSELSRNVQSPKIYEQVRQVMDSNASDEQKIKIINFFHFLNKTAMYEYNDSHNMNRQNKEVQLSELFSRYFSSFAKYIMNGSATIKEVSEMLTFLISHKESLPGWLLANMATADAGVNNRNESFHNFKDDVEQILAIDKYIKMPEEQYYLNMYDKNKNDYNVSSYVSELMSLPKFNTKNKSNTIKYVKGTDYHIYKWFKNKYESGNLENWEKDFGKFLCEYTGTMANIKAIKSLKSIKQLKSEELARYAGACADTQKNLSTLLEEKDMETKTVKSYLTILDKKITDEELMTELEEHPMTLNCTNQVVYEDENYTCFIPSFDQCAEWGEKMQNCIKWCYLPHYKKGEGVFLFICKKGQFHTPLNATHLSLPWNYRSSYNDYDNGAVNAIVKKMCKNVEYNQSTHNKKSNHYNDPEIGLLNGLQCDQCYSTCIKKSYGQPKIYELSQEGHQLQTPLEREQLYEFCLKLQEKLGFDGAEWFKDFDRVMDDYYKSVNKPNPANKPKPDQKKSKSRSSR